MPIPSTPSIMPNVLGYAADTVQIPETTPTGQGVPSFRDLFPFITQVDPDAGGVMVERAWMNALFNLLGQHAFFQQSGCIYPWQATLNYIGGSHVKGSDDVEYIALQPSGPDVSGAGVKDPTLEANRNYWISLSSFVSGDFVPDSRRVIAGTGMTGGGPLSADVTLAAKLTDSVSLADSTTAASATAVKTAYDLANSKQANLGFTPVQQGGGTGQEPDHKVYLGWNSEGLAVQVDSLNLGNIITTKAGKQLAPAAELANKLAVGPSIYSSWLYESIAGQPSYLWGSNDGVNMRVYNPANFSVNYANSAGQAQLAAPAVQWVVNTSGPAITVPPGGTYDVVCIVFNESGGKGAVKHYPGTAGGTVISNASTDYFVAGLCARVA